MSVITKSACLATLAALGLSLAACGEKTAPEPQNEVTGAAMPDTSQPGPNPPDAGATGVVPTQGAVPVQPTNAPPANAAPGTTTSGEQGLPPVDMPKVKGN